MHIRWFHKVSNTEISERATCMTIKTQVTRVRLRWSGHILRMQDTRLPKIALCGEFTEGARKPGGSQTLYKIEASPVEPLTFENSMVIEMVTSTSKDSRDAVTVMVYGSG